MTKTELIAWLQEERRQWEALLARIGPARMDQPGVNGDWSFKDLVAHLTGWNLDFLARLQAAQSGEPEPPPPWPADLQSDDDINAWIHNANRDRPLHEILDEADRQLQQLFALAAALPDDLRIDLVEPAYYLVWVNDRRFEVGYFFYHFRDDHEPDVRAWLARLEQLQ